MQQSISVSTAEPFSTSDSVPHAIRLALGSVTVNQLSEALTTIKETIEYEREF